MPIRGLFEMLLFVSACCGYSRHPKRMWVMVIGFYFIIIVVALLFVGLVFIPIKNTTITVEDLAVALLGYSAGLYALLCDVFRFGLAHRLTETRGVKWVKELDYFFLLSGSAGVFLLLTKLPVGTQQNSPLEFLGPILAATGLVLRLIKTRAEIDDWTAL
jgi:hypothetical protein